MGRAFHLERMAGAKGPEAKTDLGYRRVSRKGTQVSEMGHG